MSHLKNLSGTDRKDVLFGILDSKAIEALSNYQINEATDPEDLVTDMKVGKHRAKIYKNLNSDEYRVSFTSGGKKLPEAEFHHEDYHHAKAKAMTHLRGLKQQFGESSEEIVVNDFINEGVRKVDSYEQGRHKAVIHKDSDTGEYQVKFHTDGKHLKDADYFTDDKSDGISTAETEVNRMHEKDGKKVVE